MNELLRSLLAGPLPSPPADAGLAAWLETASAIEGRWHSPIERAIATGAAADRLGHAFVGGYQAALTRLLPQLLEPSTRVALCVTESAGNHPRAIETTVESHGDIVRVTGEKSFVTLAHHAEVLLVAARAGTSADGRPQIRLVLVPASFDGVTLADNPATPFAPEIEHARVTLEVELDAASMLPGDGYPLIKAFRTVEDLHVHAAATGYLIGVARRASWPHELLERLVAQAATLVALAPLPADDPTTHVALAGALDAGLELLEATATCWALVSEAERQRWRRDQPLLSVASKARAMRRERAWQRIEASR